MSDDASKQPPALTSLDAFKKEQEVKQANKVMKLFTDHPEAAGQAIVIWEEAKTILVPEDMSAAEVIGILERAKLSVFLESSVEIIEEG